MHGSAAGGPAAALDVDGLRKAEFPWLEEGGAAYLNSASTGPLPQRSRRAMVEFIDHCGRPDHELYRLHRDIPARVRGLCADLIGGHPDEIALGFNTTYGINLAATALPLLPGDVVLLMDGEFPANVYPWLNLRSRGVRVERIPLDSRGLPNEEAALERIARGDVAAFTVSAVSFSSGYRVDLGTISRECRRHGTYLVVDGIQALGVLPFDVSTTPVDLLAVGGQKWLLSPQGAGFAYVRRELIDRLEPATVGWLGFGPAQDFGRLLDYAFEPLPDGRRFELGSLAFASLEAFRHSLSLILELDPGRIQAHVLGVQRTLIDWVESRGDLEWKMDPHPERRSGILAFRPTGLDAAGLQRLDERLRAAGITLSIREGAIRVSVHAFNDSRDIRRLIAELEASLDARSGDATGPGRGGV